MIGVATQADKPVKSRIFSEFIHIMIEQDTAKTRSCCTNLALFLTMMEIINIMPTVSTGILKSSSGHYVDYFHHCEK